MLKYHRNHGLNENPHTSPFHFPPSCFLRDPGLVYSGLGSLVASRTFSFSRFSRKETYIHRI